MPEPSPLPSHRSLSDAVERARLLIRRSTSKLFPALVDTTASDHDPLSNRDSESDDESRINQELEPEQSVIGPRLESGNLESMPQSTIRLSFDDVQAQREDLLDELEASRVDVYFLLGDITVLAAELEEEERKWSKLVAIADSQAQYIKTRKRNPEAIMPR